MSASLVGSEMCIRDRFALSAQNGAEWAPSRAPQSDSELVSGSPSPSSVSYTHLTLPTICSV
eukprot:2529108-Alexandrium_andersonii.AAC.1